MDSFTEACGADAELDLANGGVLAEGLPVNDPADDHQAVSDVLGLVKTEREGIFEDG